MCDQITGGTVFSGEVDWSGVAKLLRDFLRASVCVCLVTLTLNPTLTLRPNPNYCSVQTGVRKATPIRCRQVHQQYVGTI